MAVDNTHVTDPPGKMAFDYSKVPLQAGDIRLLSLDRWAEDMADTKWKLKIVNMSDKPLSYHALSYRWGAPINEGRLESWTSDRNSSMNMGNSEIEVTRNLFDFLVQVKDDENLRDKDFWIDAICIDQKNLGERSRQVSSMMAEIYRKATLVIAWLGNSDTYTELAFDHITKVADREVLQSLGTPTLHKASADPGTKGTRWEAIGKVFDRTYWNRSWIIQELVLPEHVTLRCGKYSTDWLRFAEASHNISTGHWKHYFDSRITAREASNLKASKATRNYGIPAILRATKTTMKNEHWATVLLYTLIRTRDCEASDLKDKVYSLLGLIQNRPDLGQIPPLLRPHYESNGPARAYVNVAIQLLRECEDLLVLSCAEGFRVVKLDGDDLPSWVPDWSVREPLGLRVTGYKRYEADPFFVSSDTKVSREEKLQQWPADVNERELTVKLRGVKVDKISLVAESKLDIMEKNPFPKLLRMLLRLPPTYEVTGEDRLEAFWRTLILNTGQDQKAPKADSALGPSFAKWFNEKVYSSKVPQTDEEDWNKLKEEYDEICVHDSKRTKNSQHSSPSEYGSQFAYGEYLRPFLTDEGYLGLGSQNLKEGDTVWVVPRSRVPLIFRERSHGKPGTGYQCELVGGTYLHGFMDGKWLGEKALKDGLELDKMLQTIIIH